MAIPRYLAFTSAEFASCQELPAHSAWMACHFSPYGTDLTNLPDQLPPGCLLILNDRTPVHGHDPQRIRKTLEEAAVHLQYSALLLDLQRPDCPETQRIVDELLTLPCPVCVSQPYAASRDCPVFLPPVPPNILLWEYLAPWKGRQIWLEAALNSVTLTVSSDGCAAEAQEHCDGESYPHADGNLHCHYRLELAGEHCKICMKRTTDDLLSLLSEAEELGVAAAVGLYQELKAL